jgi:hypothetical protein
MIRAREASLELIPDQRKTMSKGFELSEALSLIHKRTLETHLDGMVEQISGGRHQPGEAGIASGYVVINPGEEKSDRSALTLLDLWRIFSSPFFRSHEISSAVSP